MFKEKLHETAVHLDKFGGLIKHNMNLACHCKNQNRSNNNYTETRPNPYVHAGYITKSE